MGITMDKEIARFFKQNGNVTYTTKELIAALHTKFDSLQEQVEALNIRYNSQIVNCNTRFLDKSLFWKIIGALTTAFMSIIAWIIHIGK